MNYDSFLWHFEWKEALDRINKEDWHRGLTLMHAITAQIDHDRGGNK